MLRIILTVLQRTDPFGNEYKFAGFGFNKSAPTENCHKKLKKVRNICAEGPSLHMFVQIARYKVSGFLREKVHFKFNFNFKILSQGGSGSETTKFWSW